MKAGARSPVLASTLDLVPTVLDALKVSYPPDLAGQSLLPAARGEARPARARLQGQNDRNLLGAWDRRFKIVAAPTDGGARYALFDRERDPGETRDVAAAQPDRMRGSGASWSCSASGSTRSSAGRAGCSRASRGRRTSTPTPARG